MSTNIQEWEYKVEEWKPGWSRRPIDEMLNKMGKDGWELVTLKWWGDDEPTATAVFKRPKA